MGPYVNTREAKDLGQCNRHGNEGANGLDMEALREHGVVSIIL
jgi:hypothetical protein